MEDWKLPCTCMHNKNAHRGFRSIYGEFHRTGCRHKHSDFSSCICFEFKLDNLKLIEDLAKEKGLV